VAHGPTDLVEDLDAAPGPAPHGGSAAPAGAPGPPGRRAPSWPEGTPAWVRSPLGAGAAALLAAALVGGAGVQQVRARAAADLAQQRDLALVQVGTPEVSFSGSEPPAGEQFEVPLTVAVVNGGERSVEVSVLGLSTEHVEVVGAPQPVEVAPGSSSTATLEARIDCATVPAPSQVFPGDRGPSWVDVALVADGTRHEERRLAQSRTGERLEDALPWLCDPRYYGGGASASVIPQDDERLLVLVSASGREPTQVDVRADPVLGLSSDVELPVDVPVGESVPVTVALSPDCARAGDGSGYPLEVLEVVDDPGSSYGSIADAMTTSAWVARQVALACG